MSKSLLILWRILFLPSVLIQLRAKTYHSLNGLTLKMRAVVLIEDFLTSNRFLVFCSSILSQSSLETIIRILHLFSCCSQIISSMVSFTNFICGWSLSLSCCVFCLQLICLSVSFYIAKVKLLKTLS